MTFMRRDMLCLGALDFILRVLLARAVGMSFVIKILGVYLDDCAADVPGFRVPRHVIADLESFFHYENSDRVFTSVARWGRAGRLFTRLNPHAIDVHHLAAKPSRHGDHAYPDDRKDNGHFHALPAHA